MDVTQHYLSTYTVVILTLCTLGLCSTQDISLSDLMGEGPQETEGQLRDRRTPYSTFDPEIDWSRQETDRDLDNTLVNFLKRGVFTYDSRSGRFPRINRRKIIPFYQYGNEYRSYRPSPRFTGSRKYSYFVSPWKTGGYTLGNRFNRMPTYAGLKK